jgi:hypothetical protein
LELWKSPRTGYWLTHRRYPARYRRRVSAALSKPRYGSLPELCRSLGWLGSEGGNKTNGEGLSAKRSRPIATDLAIVLNNARLRS